MKRTYILLLIISLFLGAISCSEQPSDNNSNDPESLWESEGTSRNIPCFYEQLNEIKPYRGIGFGIEPHTDNSGRIKRHVLMIDYSCRVLSSAEEKDFRETTGERNGHYKYSYHPGGYILCNRFTGISITSSEDFNEIPAGESLASKIMMFTWSVWPSINAGRDLNERGGEKDLYTKYFYFNPIPDFGSYSPVTKMLDSIEEDDLYYNGADNNECCPALFMFTELPDIKQHVFTVTYYEGEQKWSINIEADFSK